jgi:hypothetical protein
MMEEAEKAWKPSDGSALWIAGVHARLAEKDAAFEWVERAFQERAMFITLLRVHPSFTDLHGDPRLDALAKRMGLPD